MLQLRHHADAYVNKETGFNLSESDWQTEILTRSLDYKIPARYSFYHKKPSKVKATIRKKDLLTVGLFGVFPLSRVDINSLYLGSFYVRASGLCSLY